MVAENRTEEYRTSNTYLRRQMLKVLDNIMDGGHLDMDFPSMYDVKWAIREAITVEYEYFKRTYDTYTIADLPNNNGRTLHPVDQGVAEFCQLTEAEYNSIQQYSIKTDTDEFKTAFFSYMEDLVAFMTMEYDIRFKVNGMDERLDSFLAIV